IKVDQIRRFEKELYSYLDRDELGQEIINEIKETKVLPDKDKMNKLLNEFKSQFIN
ncbi:MAG: F0F1 ATP synthase subunit alpha, partial [Bacilli bacterium]|nr:F0F1 ATP synthase subunit alpha [Bacilli bacterium]